MAYSIDPLDETSPLDSDFPASNVASELRQLKARINTLADALTDAINNAMPIGTIIAVAKTGVVAANFLQLPTVETNVSRTTYSALFAVLGTIWGEGDGTTTFGLPYVPTGDTLIRGTPGTLSVGSVIAHTHPYKDAYFIESSDGSGPPLGPAIDGTITVPGAYMGGGSSDVDNDTLQYRNATTEPMVSAPTSNFASGTRVVFYIKYR